MNKGSDRGGWVVQSMPARMAKRKFWVEECEAQGHSGDYGYQNRYTIRPYKILAPLGKGGMGEVYRAKDTRLGREVAIKVLPDHLSGDASALARFEREAKVLAALSHPNILTIFDVGSENGVSFVVMELLPGETLRSRIAQRRPDWPHAVQMGIEIADGLCAAHSKGIVHRDLKPENIFLTRDEHVKILDFGLARWHHDFNTAEAESETTAGPATATGIVMWR